MKHTTDTVISLMKDGWKLDFNWRTDRWSLCPPTIGIDSINITKSLADKLYDNGFITKGDRASALATYYILKI